MNGEVCDGEEGNEVYDGEELTAMARLGCDDEVWQGRAARVGRGLGK